MNSPRIGPDELIQERAAIAKSGRLHWFHWTVVALSSVLTLGAWYFAKQQVDEKIANQFERAADHVIELVGERMRKYEDGLWGGVSAIQALGGDITYEEWRVFADNLRIDLKYHGINGIGVIHHVLPERLDAYLKNQRRTRPEFRIHPRHDKSEFLPITFVEPSSANAGAIGMDIAHETNRYRAALNARDTGTAQITGPITLVQDAGNTPSFLFYIPFYSGGTQNSVRARRENFVGMVYAPFVFNKLMEGTLEKDKRRVRIRVRDSGEILYDEANQQDGQTSLFATEKTLSIYGRTWTFDIWTTKAFDAANDNHQPIFILIGGIMIDALLLTLFIVLTRANRNAVSFVDRMTYDLRNKTAALETSNAELEKFASIASHDLQEPLRKVQAFGDRLKIKYADRLPEEGQDYIERMQGAAARMQNLIDDVLAFSRIRKADRPFESVDMDRIVRDVISDLEVRIEETEARVGVSGLPTIEADPVQMRQLIQNLMSNALKYRKPGTPPVIQISGKTTAQRYSPFGGSPSQMCEIQVKDNGIGFDSEYAERIFEVFQRLHGRTDYDGTGIGLAIVKSIAERHGGGIVAEGRSGEGATFTVTIPHHQTSLARAA